MHVKRIILLCCVGCSIVSSAIAQPSIPAFYLEALDKIRNEALTIEPGTTREEMLRASLKEYVKTLDHFSSYLTPEEYAAFKDLQKSSYIGIGMDLEATPEGQLKCIPHADSPAEAAGLRYGDLLRAVDGQEIAGKSPIAIAPLVKGAEGTTVDLTIERNGERRTFQVTRETLRSETIRINSEYAVPILRISSFKPSTQRELRSALTVLQDIPFLVLDLRGNPGGDLYSAIDSTMFFLDTNDPIVTLKPRNGSAKSYKSSNPRFNPNMQVFIWQDERTASAAEVFIAALTQNQRARSIGKTTYGKGVKQDVIELSDGSALLLSTAFLQTPDGTVYDTKGLTPNEMLTAAFPETSDYFAKVAQFTGQVQTVASPAPIPIVKPTATPLPLAPTAQPAHVSAPQPISTPRQEEPGSYLICFDKVYQTQEEAYIRLSAIQKSFTQLPAPYLLQRSTPKAVEFLICFGGFTSQNEAEQERLRISDATNFPMFLQAMPEQKTVTDAPAAQMEIEVDPPRKKGWGILVGTYETYTQAKDVGEVILNKGEKYGVRIWIVSRGRGQEQTQNQVFIGPYNAPDDILLDALKHDHLLPSDADWQPMP